MWRAQWRALGKCVFLALVPVMAAGCGSSKVKIAVTVSYRGKPLQGGVVTFSSTAGKGDSTARIAEDGTYTIENCPTGPVKILVDTESIKPRPAGTFKPPKNAPPAGQGASANYTPPEPTDMSKRYVAIPLDYGDPKTSKLDYVVKSGETKKDITLD